jgi:3-hydroxyethyl bacteriochlorophyllide a dehydrogenase
MKLSKAIVFSEIGKVEYRDVPIPEQGEWDVTVEVESSAISIGTERWALLGKRPPGDVKFPCIPGYLSIGRIISKGKSVTNFNVGDRINYLAAKNPEGYTGNWMCGHVSPAVVNVNPNQDSWFGMPYVEKVPENISSELASLAGLSAVACRGIDMAKINPGDKVLLVGQGMIGHAASQICRILGAQTLAADTMDIRVDFSKKLAADRAVNTQKEDLAKAVKEFTSEKGADVIIDTTGSVAMINQEIEYLRPFGKFIFQGWYPPPNDVSIHKLHLKFTTAYYPCGHSGEAVRRCMDWLASGKLNLAPLISHRFSPKEAVEAYRLILDKPNEAMAVVFNWK